MPAASGPPPAGQQGRADVHRHSRGGLAGPRRTSSSPLRTGKQSVAVGGWSPAPRNRGCGLLSVAPAAQGWTQGVPRSLGSPPRQRAVEPGWKHRRATASRKAGRPLESEPGGQRAQSAKHRAVGPGLCSAATSATSLSSGHPPAPWGVRKWRRGWEAVRPVMGQGGGSGLVTATDEASNSPNSSGEYGPGRVRRGRATRNGVTR